VHIHRLTRFAPLLAFALVLVVAVSASAAPPRSAEFVPGRSLAGVRLGMTKQEVLAAWGKRHGICRNCPNETWYFNYKRFTPEGAGVVFARGRVVHVFTVWRPPGWRTPEGLVLGAPASEVSRVYGSLDRRQCTFYYALLKPGKTAQSAFYVFRDRLWGFGLTRPNASPCL
jgi:hypothetical protein